MANSPLIEVRPGAGLDSGIFPTAEASSGPIWREARNAWFRPLKLAHTLGREKVLNIVGRSPLAMAQAYVDGETRLYYEDLGIVNVWRGSSVPSVIDDFSSLGDYDLEPYGEWLLATDNINPLKLWKNDDMGFADIGTGQFSRAKIIKKLAQRVLVYDTDVLPSGMHYSAPSDPEQWEPTVAAVVTGAGNLPFRNLDSPVIAVADLGGAHGVYTEDSLLILEYLGEALRFGTPRQPIKGIGAVSKRSVISRGSRNYGLFSGGVFVTDGQSFKLLDEPAMSDWITEEIDWSRKEEINGYHDRNMKCNVWTVPRHGGESIGVTLDDQGRFSFLDCRAFTSALAQEVFDAPFIAAGDGIYKTSIPDTCLGDFTAVTHLFNGGTSDRYKAWDFCLFEGSLSGEVRFGYADEPKTDLIDWTEWEELKHRVPLTPRESVFFAIEFKAPSHIDICAIRVYGGLGGLVV